MIYTTRFVDCQFSSYSQVVGFRLPELELAAGVDPGVVFADAARTVIVARLEGEKGVLTDAPLATDITPASTT